MRLSLCVLLAFDFFLTFALCFALPFGTGTDVARVVGLEATSAASVALPPSGANMGVAAKAS